LHLAAEYGHKEIASLLLREGAQADSGNWSDKTALHYAAEKGHIEIIELLLSKGANVNALGGSPTGTPLDFATHFKRTKAAAFLREKKAKTGEQLKTEGE
jgi:ankyrin repeat protein